MYILATNNNIYLRLEKSNSEGLIFAIKSIYIKKVIPVFFIFFERFCNTYNWDFVETILFGFIKPTFWICKIYINVIKKFFFQEGAFYGTEQFVCKVEPFLYFKINCKVILKFWRNAYIIVFRLRFISIPHGLLG